MEAGLDLSCLPPCHDGAAMGRLLDGRPLRTVSQPMERDPNIILLIKEHSSIDYCVVQHAALAASGSPRVVEASFSFVVMQSSTRCSFIPLQANAQPAAMLATSRLDKPATGSRQARARAYTCTHVSCSTRAGVRTMIHG